MSFVNLDEAAKCLGVGKTTLLVVVGLTVAGLARVAVNSKQEAGELPIIGLASVGGLVFVALCTIYALCRHKQEPEKPKRNGKKAQ